jgi:hypothetical protein
MNIEMCSSGAPVIKLIDGRAVDIECQMFSSLFGYDQHRPSSNVRETACCAFPDENRTTMTAAPRPNMSTTALECRA